MDAVKVDREGAKALLAEAEAGLPASAALRVARGLRVSSDPTLDEQVALARGEALLRDALDRDPGPPTRGSRSRSCFAGAERLDDADEVLAASPRPGGGRARATALALARARLAEARGSSSSPSARRGGDRRRRRVPRAELGLDLAGRRRAVAVEDARARAHAACRDGRERLADHLRRRGDPAGAAAPSRRSWRRGRGRLSPPWPARTRSSRQATRAAVLRSSRSARSAAQRRAWRSGSPMRSSSRGDAASARAPASARCSTTAPTCRSAAARARGRPRGARRPRRGRRAAIRAYEAARRPTTPRPRWSSTPARSTPPRRRRDRAHPPGDPRARPAGRRAPWRAVAPSRRGGDRGPHASSPTAARSSPSAWAPAKGRCPLAGLEPGDYVDVEYVRSSVVSARPSRRTRSSSAPRASRSSCPATSSPRRRGSASRSTRTAPPRPSPSARARARWCAPRRATSPPTSASRPARDGRVPPVPSGRPRRRPRRGPGGPRRRVRPRSGRPRSSARSRAQIRAAAGKDAGPAALARAAWARSPANPRLGRRRAPGEREPLARPREPAPRAAGDPHRARASGRGSPWRGRSGATRPRGGSPATWPGRTRSCG